MPRFPRSSLKVGDEISPAMKPIMDVAVKNAPISACAGRMPTRVNGIGAPLRFRAKRVAKSTDLNSFPLRETSLHLPCSMWAIARKPSYLISNSQS